MGSLCTLLLMQGTSAQEALLAVQEKLAVYTKTQLPEKVFVHTDKNFYTAGEIVWYKLYVVDGVFHKPLNASKVGYVELLDKNNTPVFRAKLALDEKGGSASIQLPLGLPSGYYTLRGYTNWMKNMGVAHFFEKSLAIINTLKSPETKAEKLQPSYKLQLFPEGGNLVNGLPSKVAFHLTNKLKGISGKGYLLDAKNDTLASFIPYKFGMGHFDLTPQSGNAYRVTFVIEDGQTISEVLPTAFDRGYTMRLEDAGNDKVKLTIQTNEQADYPEVYLLAQTRQVVKTVQKNVTTGGTAIFLIDKKSLGEGVSQFTLFDSERKPVCERLYFIPPTATKERNLVTAKAVFNTREKVELSLNATPGEQESLSLAVYQLDELQADEDISIEQYLWLTSELNGLIEHPAFYFSKNNKDAAQAADYLMLTHGWRRFKWEDALKSVPVIKFPRERFGHIVTGKVTDVRTNTPASGIQVFLSVPNTSQKLFTAVSNTAGLVQFNVMGYYGSGEMVAQTNIQRDSFFKVEILSPFAEMYTNSAYPRLDVLPSQQTALVNHSIGMQAQHLYISDSINRFYRPSLADSFVFYGQPLHRYKLDDYVRFNTMEEVLREYVRQVSVGVKGNGASLRFKMFHEINRDLYSDDMLVMVDGVPLFDPNKVFQLDPLKIKQLDIINRNYVFGPTSFRGLANFSSYNGFYEGVELDARAITIDYEGLQLHREFYSPDYSTDMQRSSRLPDLRSTLYWQPKVNTQQLSFYTGDNKGHYLIVLQGIDADGTMVYTTSQFEVK